MCLRREVVYVFDDKIPPMKVVDEFLLREDLTRIPANQDTITKYFKYSQKKKPFIKNLIDGSIGCFLVNEKEWVTYAWMSTPGQKPPTQIPNWVKNEQVYWIYYCRTKENYQSKGYYKAALKILIMEAYYKNKNAGIFIDTNAANIPSRKAILSSGFSPAGVIKSLPIRIPKRHLITIGKWGKGSKHPLLS